MGIRRLPSTGDAPRSTGVPESLVPGGVEDSAGVPWQGRTFAHHDTAFAADDGKTPAGFGEAVRALRAACVAADAQLIAQAHADTLVALSAIRVLIPLLAEAGEVGVGPDGRPVEKTQELSIVTVGGPDGRKVMPAFTSVEAMRAWNPHARPIPVPMPQAALAAAQEQTDLIIIDPGNAETEFGVRRTQLAAVALGQRILPAWADADVRTAFRQALIADARVVAVDLLPGDPQSRLLHPEAEVVLHLVPGLDRESLTALIEWAHERWAASELIAERVDSLRVRVRSSDQLRFTSST